MGGKKIDMELQQNNALILDISKSCKRNPFHRDMTYFSYLVFLDRLISVNDELQIVDDLERPSGAVILDDTHQHGSSEYRLENPSFLDSTYIDSTIMSRDYDIGLLNIIEYQQQIFTDL